MAMKCPLDWEIYRRASPWGDGEMGDRCNGYLRLTKRQMKIVFSNGLDWEHVSVSVIDRCPTWEEMEEVTRRFWAPEDTVMQLHVPVADHKNCHPYFLHLWRPMTAAIPRPPSIMVAP
jgi:hypothetical protein